MCFESFLPDPFLKMPYVPGSPVLLLSPFFSGGRDSPEPARDRIPFQTVGGPWGLGGFSIISSPWRDCASDIHFKTHSLVFLSEFEASSVSLTLASRQRRAVAGARDGAGSGSPVSLCRRERGGRAPWRQATCQLSSRVGGHSKTKVVTLDLFLLSEHIFASCFYHVPSFVRLISTLDVLHWRL